MEQRTAGERQRGGGLNRRGNAASSAASDSDAGPDTKPVRRFGTSPPSAFEQPAGRHRSPWGRQGRILPIRWGRIAAGCLVALAVVGALTGYALLRGTGPETAETAGGGSAPAGQPSSDTSRVTVAGPSQSTGDPAGLASASPAPGTGPGLLPSETPVPPPPTASGPAATLVATPAGPRATGPALSLGRTSVDLGQVDSTDTIDLTNTGSTAFTVRIGDVPSYLTAAPRVARLDPGYRTQLVITLDRSAAPVGQLDIPVSVTPSAGTGGGTVHVTAIVTAGPKILSVNAPSSLRAQACATEQSPATGPLTVEVQDPVGMSGGSVTVTAPNGTATTVALQLGSSADDRSTWTAQLGPSTDPGTLALTITVKDLNNRVASQRTSVTVAACS